MSVHVSGIVRDEMVCGAESWTKPTVVHRSSCTNAIKIPIPTVSSCIRAKRPEQRLRLMYDALLSWQALNRHVQLPHSTNEPSAANQPTDLLANDVFLQTWLLQWQILPTHWASLYCDNRSDRALVVQCSTLSCQMLRMVEWGHRTALGM
eukprot:TRINITY_DN10700_c0_g1_i1.p2 TRINITY_DN10700_c0_g1~~TRINITY_DN10700_c0_g1_i1.p2  ORF type:complete len:150 (-),score=0.68 TRINITY_DN10700_c0_g1_i1:724-1173(-)